MSPATRPDYPELTLRSRAAWRRWLVRNHRSSRGVWFVHFKKASGERGVSYDECVEEALCFGWIDSTIRTLDEARYVHLLTPRTDRSNWSAINRKRMQQLIAAGRVEPAGLEAFKPGPEGGKAEPAGPPAVPDFFKRALMRNAAARRTFESLAPGYRQQYLVWLTSAKREETRARRLAAAIESLAAGRRLGMKPGLPSSLPDA